MSVWTTGSAIACDVCRGQWATGQRPRLLGDSIRQQALLYRCDACGTLWIETERNAAPLSLADARRDFDDIGVDFEALDD